MVVLCAARRAFLLALVFPAVVVPSDLLAFEDPDVRAIVRHSESIELEEGWGGHWMGLDKKLMIDGEGNWVILEHSLAKIADPDWGQRHFRPFVVPYSSENHSARLIKARIWDSVAKFTEVSPESVSTRVSTLTEGVDAYRYVRELVVNFPPLAPGQLVEIQVERANRVRGGMYNVRWFVHLFGKTEPVVEEQLLLRVPSALYPLVQREGKLIQNRIRREGGTRSRQWITGNLPGHDVPVFEGMNSRIPGPQTELDDSSTVILFSTNGDWGYYSRYYGRFWEHHIENSVPEMSLNIGKFMAAESGVMGRAQRIEKHVQEDYRTLDLHHELLGVRPMDSGVIFEAGAGSPRDKACLMVSLFRLAGVPAVPVMVRSRVGLWSADVPNPGQLDRFMVMTEYRDQRYWFDPVESETPLPPGQAWKITLAEDDLVLGLIDFPGRSGGSSSSSSDSEQ